MSYQIFCEDCISVLRQINQKVDLTFLDPPFNQQKDYAFYNDNVPTCQYWRNMQEVCKYVYDLTNDGGCLYFMQREKNTGFVLQILSQTGWIFQNLIIWKKRTSAVPVKGKYSKQYQIIVYATKGEKAKTFHRLRINPKLPANYKMRRENGIFVTDVWDDIRELTSGYFAGSEAIRLENGTRFHKQQAPLALLLRIILTSTKVGDVVLDPFAGTGTTSSVALQIQRDSVAIEIDPNNVNCIQNRLTSCSDANIIQKYYQDYIYTDGLPGIWGDKFEVKQKPIQDLSLFSGI
jgi:DNA modification methylase